MPVAFPSIKPTERDYRPPEFAVTTVKSQSGVTSRRLWGSAPGGAELSLGFRHVHTDVAAQILQAYLATKSGVDTVILPSQIFAGMGSTLKSQIEGARLSWTFAERPTVTFVGPIWATVNVRLIGELRMS